MKTAVCQCGCGNPAPIAKFTIAGRQERGKPVRFIRGHNGGMPRATKHGHTVRGKVSPEYRSWRMMKQRCCNPNFGRYPEWGGRGIAVCERWRLSFEAFLADMGPRPEGTTLDRINNDGDYEPSNCRWATRAEQTANRRKEENEEPVQTA